MKTLELRLEPSPLLFYLFSGIYLGTAIIVLTLQIFIILKICILVFLIFQYKKIIDLHARRKNPDSIVGLYKDSHGKWTVWDKKGRVYRGVLSNELYVTAWIIILRMRLKSRCLTIILPKDALATLEYHVLRLQLKQNPTPRTPFKASI